MTKLVLEWYNTLRNSLKYIQINTTKHQLFTYFRSQDDTAEELFSYNFLVIKRVVALRFTLSRKRTCTIIIKKINKEHNAFAQLWINAMIIYFNLNGSFQY